MAALLIILLGTVLIQGSAIALGNVPAAAHARGNFATELRTALVTLITITLAAVLGFTVMHYLLIPWQLEYLRTPAIVMGVALIVVCIRSAVPSRQPLTDRPAQRMTLLAQLTVQCALLGIAFFTATFTETVSEAFAYGVGAACALALLSAAFAALMERIDNNSIPFVFRGIPLALISAGFMALALMGFVGLIRS